MASANAAASKAAEKTPQSKGKKPGCLRKALRWFVILSVVGTALVYAMLRETTVTPIPDPTPCFYANDFSGVLSANSENWLQREGEALCARTGAQLAVVAVPHTGEETLEGYSLKLATQWALGDAERDNGLLLLFTTDEAHVRMEVGTGLEGDLPDALCGRLLDEWAVEPMRVGQWNKAALQCWTAAAKIVYQAYGLEPPETLAVPPEPVEAGETGSSADADFPQPVTVVNEEPLLYQLLIDFLVFWLLAGLPFLFLLLVWRMGGRSGRSGGSGASGGWSGSGGSSGGGGGGFSGGGASR